MSGPNVRLAVPIDSEGYTVDKKTRRALAPDIRLAHVPGAQGDNNLRGQRGVTRIPETSAPALLVSYVYLEPFLKARKDYAYRDWALDSGAFSAHNSGVTVDLWAYIEKCRELLATDPKLTEVFALDVIGDWRKTLENTDKMWKAGVPAIPCYHLADQNWDVLLGMARDYPKIALGGIADLRGDAKRKFAEQCFARVWPKKVHGFGCGSRDVVLALPWHSTDATNWEVGACKWGRWRAYGRMSVRGSAQNLRSEVEYYLRLEREARSRWAKEMALLDAEDAPGIRLAMAKMQDPEAATQTDQRIRSALSPGGPRGGPAEVAPGGPGGSRRGGGRRRRGSRSPGVREGLQGGRRGVRGMTPPGGRPGAPAGAPLALPCGTPGERSQRPPGSWRWHSGRRAPAKGGADGP